MSGTILTKGREVGSSTRGEERTKAEKQARQDNTKDNAGQESLSKALYLRQRANKSLSFLQSFFGQVIVRVYTFRYMGFTCVILKIPMKPWGLIQLFDCKAEQNYLSISRLIFTLNNYWEILLNKICVICALTCQHEDISHVKRLKRHLFQIEDVLSAWTSWECLLLFRCLPFCSTRLEPWVHLCNICLFVL